MAWLLHGIFRKFCPVGYVKKWHISGNSFSTSPFTQSLLWLWLWLWFCWTQKMAWKFWLGENGACLCDRQPSHGPCTPPSSIAPSENFSPPSNPLKLDSHSIFWTAIQFVLSIKRWNRSMEKRWHGFVTVGQFMNTVQSFDNFVQLVDIFVEHVTYRFHWGFFQFVEFTSTFFACANFVPIFCINIFTKKPQLFQQVTIIFSFHAFWHRSCNNISWTRTKPPVHRGARLATGNTPRSGSMGHFWHSVSIRLMIYGNVIAWRTGGLKFPDE